MITPPLAKEKKVEHKIGKNKVIDNYHWLSNKDSKDVVNYINEENQYTNKIMKKTGMTAIKTALTNRMKNMIVDQYDTSRLPSGKDGWNSPYRFFNRYLKNKKYPIFMYEHIESKIERIFFNPNNYVKPGESLIVSSPCFNEDLSILGIGLNYNGNESYIIKLYRFPDMIEIENKLPEIMHDYFQIYNNDIFYCKSNKNSKTKNFTKIIKYDIITQKEVEIYSIEDNMSRNICFFTNSEYNYFFYGWANYEDNEINVIPMNQVENIYNVKQEVILKNKKGVTYYTDIIGNYIFVLGNINGCVNRCIFYRKIGENNWKQLVKYNENISTEEFYPVKDGFLISGRVNGMQFLRYIEIENLFDISNSSKLKIKRDDCQVFGKNGYNLEVNYCNKDSKDFVYCLEDLKTPTIMYKATLPTAINAKSLVNNKKIIWTKKINNYKPNNYETKRIWINNDGICLPVDILRNKTVKQNDSKNSKNSKNSKKVLIYTYSSYGINKDCIFDLAKIAFVDQGFEFALTNVRGSSYLGNSFYKAGKLLNRMNTFNDINCIAEYFHKKGYSVNLEGRSAGGLVSSASSLLRPELYTSVISIVPFVDVLYVMSNPNIPLTLGEWTEVGNTNIQSVFNYIKQYSPINIIKNDVKYPNYYIESGYNDARVKYWQPVKLTALLRKNIYETNNDNLVLLRTYINGGHFNNYERYKEIESSAEKYAYLIVTNQ